MGPPQRVQSLVRSFVKQHFDQLPPDQVLEARGTGISHVQTVPWLPVDAANRRAEKLSISALLMF